MLYLCVMNYKPNEIEWNIGDIVIHDADSKHWYMLMKVIGIDGDRYKTTYINRAGNADHYWNRKEVLHDPSRFNL